MSEDFEARCHQEHDELKTLLDEHTHDELAAVGRIAVVLEGPIIGENIDGTPKHDDTLGLTGRIGSLERGQARIEKKLENGIKLRIPWYKIGGFTGGVMVALWRLVL